MAALSIRIRLLIAAMALLIVAAAVPAIAQRASPTDPNANAVSEQQLFQQLNRIRGLGTIPDTKSYTIEQPMGRVWRAFHEIWLHWIGAIFILGMVALLAIYYFVHGRNPIEGGRSGRKIVRFTGIERFTHWVIAVSFVILAITGLNITFGKVLLLPLIGPAAFSRWSIAAKYAHDFSSFPFVIGVVVLFFLWVNENIFNKVDLTWFKQGGGMIGHQHPPAYKFNGGQKLLFWLVIIATIGVALSGFNLLFPFYLTDILGMQAAQAIHALIAVAFVALIIGHIFIGTMGMEGAFEAMGEGDVDLNWAKQHHPLWVEQELGQGRGAEPPAAPQTAPVA